MSVILLFYLSKFIIIVQCDCKIINNKQLNKIKIIIKIKISISKCIYSLMTAWDFSSAAILDGFSSILFPICYNRENVRIKYAI